MTDIRWRDLDRAVDAAAKELRKPAELRSDPLKPFREAAWQAVADARLETTRRHRAGDRGAELLDVLAETMPWKERGMFRAPFTARTTSWLLDSMAANATTLAQLDAVFVCMDATRMLRGIPSATGDAGFSLISRADGSRPQPPLPNGWEQVADRARFTNGSSGAFWATSMLEAAGKRVRPPEREDLHPGDLGAA